MPDETGRDAGDGESEGEPSSLNRRRLLALLGGVGVLGGGAYAGSRLSDGGESPPEAPDLYFGERERWYPTDPRPYASTDDEGRTVVDGFDALDGYSAAFDGDGPPAPTAFYHVVDVGARLTVVQFWFYSAFDQFSVNFHWHDWELLQTFVDRETDRPVLHSASAHSRKVPNNEFFDPDPEADVSIVTEVGSHSSALGVNREPASFQRFPTGDLIADITNRAVALADLVEEVPMAYGLPRDEGFSLPYAVPELDGAPLYDHDRLPNVTPEDFVDEDVTVRNFADLASPPSLPRRETGLVLAPDDGGDYRYDLVPMSETDHIEAYVGPQLSFEFAVPGFAEDAVAGHITTAGTPQTQPRYGNPVEDVTDPRHRATLAERYESVGSGSPVSRLVGAVREVVPDENAPTGGVAFAAPSVEAVALLESEGTGIPTTNGLLLVENVPAGEHRLTLNGAGVAPYAETFTQGEGGDERAVGADGRVALVRNEDAVKVRADASDGTGVASVRIDDDYAGTVYDATPPGEDRFGVYVHREGAYTVRVTDREGDVGVFRANPGPEDDTVTIENPTPGKRSRIRYLIDLLEESLARVAELREEGSAPADDLEPIENQLREALRRAERARGLAAEGDAGGANEALTGVGENLDTIRELVEARRDRFSEEVYEGFRRRQRRLREATAAARAASLSTRGETERETARATETETPTPTDTPTDTSTERPTATERPTSTENADEDR